MSGILSKNLLVFFFLLWLLPAAEAQFAPAAGMPGSTAISKDTSLFTVWANACSVVRGYMDISIPDSGFVSVGDANSATGAAGTNGVLSLGDGGSATLTFATPIYNGPGFDFAVFENGFYTQGALAFLEFAFVEVSSDGNNFIRFPATSNISDSVQIPMTGVDCSLVNNLAGKYVFGYGTPFDLEELKNESGLDVNNITQVRLIDVVGSINETFASYDQYGHKVNDPYPTLFPSGGFDLDAVGVIHSKNIADIPEAGIAQSKINVSPNPVQDAVLQFTTDKDIEVKNWEIYSVTGKLLSKGKSSGTKVRINVSELNPGMYLLKCGNAIGKFMLP